MKALISSDLTIELTDLQPVTEAEEASSLKTKKKRLSR